MSYQAPNASSNPAHHGQGTPGGSNMTNKLPKPHNSYSSNYWSFSHLPTLQQTHGELNHGSDADPVTPSPEMGEQHPETFQTLTVRNWWAGQILQPPAHLPIGMLMIFLAFTDRRQQLPKRLQEMVLQDQVPKIALNQTYTQQIWTLSHNPNGQITKTPHPVPVPPFHTQYLSSLSTVLPSSTPLESTFWWLTDREGLPSSSTVTTRL